MTYVRYSCPWLAETEGTIHKIKGHLKLQCVPYQPEAPGKILSHKNKAYLGTVAYIPVTPVTCGRLRQENGYSKKSLAHTEL